MCLHTHVRARAHIHTQTRAHIITIYIQVSQINEYMSMYLLMWSTAVLHIDTHMQTCIRPTSTSHPTKGPFGSISRMNATPSASFFPLPQPPTATVSSPQLYNAFLTGLPASIVKRQVVSLVAAKESLKVPSIRRVKPTPTPCLNILKALFSFCAVSGYLPFPHIST